MDVDRISELPDCILSHILTMLSMKDLLKTSILSTRWRNVWYLRRDLYFDILNLDMNMKNNRRDDGDAFAKRVDQFVKSFRGTVIDSFVVNFYLNRDQSNIVDRWISFALTRRVGRIDLLFLGRSSAKPPNLRNYLKLDFALFLNKTHNNASSLNHISLENCLVCHPTNCHDFTSFKNLRYLSLDSSKLGATFIECLLSICLRLEELCLLLCEFESSMPEIISSSLCHLKVISCFYSIYNTLYIMEVNLILVDCPNLISLELNRFQLISSEDGGLDTLMFNTPKLKSITFLISRKQKLKTLVTLIQTFFPQLETMHVTTFFMVTTSLPVTRPFKHLKQLNLMVFIYPEILDDVEYDPLWILNILHICPLLQKLSVMFSNPEFSENQEVIRDIEIFSHSEIKDIKLEGCVGNWYEIEFVMNVLKYGHNKLEQIVMSPYWIENDLLDLKSNPVWFQSGRERINEMLQSEEVGVGREKLVRLL